MHISGFSVFVLVGSSRGEKQECDERPLLAEEVLCSCQPQLHIVQGGYKTKT